MSQETAPELAARLKAAELRIKELSEGDRVEVRRHNPSEVVKATVKSVMWNTDMTLRIPKKEQPIVLDFDDGSAPSEFTAAKLAKSLTSTIVDKTEPRDVQDPYNIIERLRRRLEKTE